MTEKIHFRTILLLVLIWTLQTAFPAFAEGQRKQVLYLNSYQNGYVWSDNILDGIRDQFRSSSYVIDIQVEYMDAKKHPAQSNREILKKLFANKFNGTSFDAIITSDNAAFQFILTNREELFPGVPMVFCGVNDLRPKVLSGHKDISGVVEELDIPSNLELALSLNPGKKKVVVVSDNSLSSTAIVEQIKESMPDFKGRLEFQFWNDVPLEELLVRSRTLPGDSILFGAVPDNSSGLSVWQCEKVV